MPRVALLVSVLLGLSLSVAAQGAPGAPQVAPGALPAEIPIFPLPEVVLFPGVSRPLLIYEPRYRDMVADALAGDRVIGMVLLRPGYEQDYEGRPPVYGVGCAGVIENYERLEDGRYVILLRGTTVFRIVGEDHSKSYRVARVDAVPDRLEDRDLGPLSTVRERLTELLYKVLPLGAEPPDPGVEDAEFVNITAQALNMPEAARQDLLEERSILSRAQMLVDRLEQR